MLVQEGDISLQKAAARLGQSVDYVETRMRELGYHIPVAL